MSLATSGSWSASAVAPSEDFSTAFVHTSTSSSVPHPAQYSCFRIDDRLRLLRELTHCMRYPAPAHYGERTQVQGNPGPGHTSK